MIVVSVGDVFCFFFFKQKTAYELRISDWSSDVCSSDLSSSAMASVSTASSASTFSRVSRRPRAVTQLGPGGRGISNVGSRCSSSLSRRKATLITLSYSNVRAASTRTDSRRSEEHTSELQSLMRITYAVFCVNKKKHQ